MTKLKIDLTIREEIQLGLFGHGKDIPRGMQFVFQNLYEIQSLIKSFLVLKERKEFFENSHFFEVFFLSATYSTPLLARQLFSTTHGDHSLKTMWKKLINNFEKDFFYEINLFIESEVPKSLSKLNKNVLHNEFNDFSELVRVVDELLNCAAEVIGIFSQKVNCHIRPPRGGDEAFKGMEELFNDSEIELMKSVRKDYLAKIWSKTHHIYYPALF
ncbi:MAG: hypothetical protein V4694_05570 [Pseudomonadota bacterium]